jgi:hypothetical protein
MGDIVSASGITALSNGNYVVRSPNWNGNLGAATWGNGATGVSGVISTGNSLVGSSAGDRVASLGVTALSNGNYVVSSPNWNNSLGAVTWGNGTAGTSGGVSTGNSLVGSTTNDSLGSGGVTALGNGNYVVSSPTWNNNRGAVTWGNGTAGVRGTLDASGSLVGSTGGDQYTADRVGLDGVTALSNGNYVVRSPSWNFGRGAATWGSGIGGISGVVSAANSLVSLAQFGVTPLSNGNYVVRSVDVGSIGAATWASGTTGLTLDGSTTITTQNSIEGYVGSAGQVFVQDSPPLQAFVAAFSSVDASRGQVYVGFTDPNLLTFTRGKAQTITITPAFLTRTLNSGTAVVLQASNDITISSPIFVNAFGAGGALTLQAGRSILINASIFTDNGALTLIANDTRASGVQSAQRDPGPAVISMGPGTFLDTGSGALSIELRDGKGRAKQDSGAIALQDVYGGAITVANNGTSTGSDLILNSATSTGGQNYATPNGTTTILGSISAADSPVVFQHSVVLGDDVTLSAGTSAIRFAGANTQTLQAGVGATFANFEHTGGSLQLLSDLTVTGTFTNSAGSFDANDQAVTVTGQATVSNGTYFAGVGVQTFTGGLTLTGGTFTTSTGPMNVAGAVTVSGGLLIGPGTVGTVTTTSGTVQPGPGLLDVAGAITLNSTTTFRAELDGTGDDQYSRMRATGPIDLGTSTLALTLGFTPTTGATFTLLSGSAGVTGTFAGLAEGATFTQGGINFRITYKGGADGKSVVLTTL